MRQELLCACLFALCAAVPRLEMAEVTIPSKVAHSNPFVVDCWAMVTGPASSARSSMNITLFYDGGGAWKLRFTPDVVGTWTWTTTCHDDKDLDGKSGTVSCTTGTSKGGVVVNQKFPHVFKRDDGSRYLPIGLEVDWLWALGLQEETSSIKLDDFVSHIASFGFNHVLVNVYANFSGWNAKLPALTPPRVSPTTTIPWADANKTMLSLPFFQHYDRMLQTLDKYGVVAHMMLYVGNKGVMWPERGSVEDDTYWKYVMARLGAFNSVLFDVSKEAGSYGVSKEYVLDRLALIHRMNAHGRPVTSHSGIHWSNDCTTIPVSMCSVQQHYDDHNGGQWYDQMAECRRANPTMPVMNVEFMYEAGLLRACNGSAGHDCVSTPEDVATARKVWWDLYLAGGSGVWYNCDQAWDVITMGTSKGFEYAKYLSSFWDSVNFLPMEACDLMMDVSDDVIGHCANYGGREYVVHVRSKAQFKLTVVGASAPLQGTWYDPSTGKSVPGPQAVPNGLNSFGTPDEFPEDTILHLFETPTM